MKRILLAFTIFAVVLTAAPQVEARDVSINFFYDNLGDDGYWLDVEGYGYCWQPTVAVSNQSWRPYSDGYWAYTNVGWTWVSYEPFGWATYHYGRWARLRNHGWVWVPGYEWGPAWVSWRTGGNYVGWAPLPPRRSGPGGEIVYSGRPISGFVDIDYDIGPSYYNFVDVRYIGAPVLSRHIFASTRNVAYINQTVNVTNITYTNNVVHNYGPDFNRMSAYSTQPIQRLSLQRTEDAVASGRDARGFSRVQGNQLIVAAPPRIEQPAAPVAPPAVKTRVEQPTVETGWSDITDENARAQLREKFKKEDRKNIPPPAMPPKNPEALNAATDTAAPAPAGSPTAADVAATAGGASDEPAVGRGRSELEKVRTRPEQPKAAAAAAEGQDTAAAAAPGQEPNERARGKNRRDARPTVQQPQAPTTTDEERQETAGAPAADQPSEPAVDRRGRGNQRDRQAPAAAPKEAESSVASAGGAPRQEREPKQKGQPPDRKATPDLGTPSSVPAAQPEPAVRERVAPPQTERVRVPENRGREKKAEREAAPASQPPAAEAAPEPRQPRTQRAPQPAPQQVAPASAPPEGAAPPPGRGGGRPDKGERGDRGGGKKKKDAAAPDEQEP